MTDQLHDTALLEDPIARELLSSTRVAHLAYTWSDGTPRVVPIWFHWDGKQVVMSSPLRAPKLNALTDGAAVAITIDSNEWPYKVLTIRGTASVKCIDGVAPEYDIRATTAALEQAIHILRKALGSDQPAAAR